MITLPEALQKFMQQQDLTGLKPYALLYRNKWVEEESGSGSGDEGHYELETTPIDITDMIVKPNTLSMTLDVNEVAQYNCNNVTLTLADTKNRFIEGTQNSLFPDGYQIYGSKVVLYYGLNNPINPFKTQVGYTVVGNPTIENGVISGFSNVNYASTSQALNSSLYSSLEINCRLKTPVNFVRGWSNVLMSGSFNPVAGIGIYTSDMSYFNIFGYDSYDTPAFLSADTWYRVKCVVQNNLQNTYVYADDGTLLQARESLPVRLNTNAIIDFGKKINDGVIQVIDLKNTNVKADNDFWFNGAYFFWKNNSTPLFTGSIKELPTHKPEQYQVELKLVSPLEMLKDIEAKDFSDKVTGETLTFIETDSDGHRIYNTTGTGVGGFDGVYADGNKLFEGVDYEIDQLNTLGLPAIVTIINSDLYSATITADYYCWKTNLTVGQIVAGLVGLAGYDSGTEDIRNVVWNTGNVRNPPQISSVFAALGYRETSLNEYAYSWQPTYGSWAVTAAGERNNILPSNFDYSFGLGIGLPSATSRYGTISVSLGDEYNGNGVSTSEGGGITGVLNGISVRYYLRLRSQPGQTVIRIKKIYIHQITNGVATLLAEQDLPFTAGTSYQNTGTVKISRRGNIVNFYLDDTQIATCTVNGTLNYHNQAVGILLNVTNLQVFNQTWDFYDNNLRLYAAGLTNPCIVTDICDKTAAGDTWGAIDANLTNGNASYFLNVYFSDDLTTWSNPQSYNLNTVIGITDRYLYYILGISSAPGDSFDISDPTTWYLASTLLLNLINLSGKTVLEALQDFALISGYEFGVDRNGVFFFKPRIQSTTPTYLLDHSELTKVDTVKRNFSDFFTKLTLTFAQRPLEFYANSGPRPTAVDKYGIINKEIDKPDIVNYDNPELAQAIGPQLLQVYSQLSNIIQATGKLNLALELGDIVSLRRDMNLIQPNDASEYKKFINSDIYYRACKITGMNYNFAKRQITYTLRDVTDENNYPPISAYGFPYELPIALGKLKED